MCRLRQFADSGSIKSAPVVKALQAVLSVRSVRVSKMTRFVWNGFKDHVGQCRHLFSILVIAGAAPSTLGSGSASDFHGENCCVQLLPRAGLPRRSIAGSTARRTTTRQSIEPEPA